MKPKRFVVPAAVAIMVVAALGACHRDGASDNASETAEHYLHAIGNKKPEAACRLIVKPDSKKPLTKDSKHWDDCVSGMQDSIDDETNVGKFKKAEVKSAHIDGDEAEVSKDDISGVGSSADDLELGLKKIDGKWYMADA